MTTITRLFALPLIIVSTFLPTSCIVDDPGPIQYTERQFAMSDFDRLEMGSAFHIDVKHGDFFSVTASGDRRNIEDLIVEKEGSTLVIRYRDGRNRRHDTDIEITMPELYAVNFSGASESRVYGFGEQAAFSVSLSGASVCQVDLSAMKVNVILSGASYLNIHGEAEALEADVSGASVLRAFNFPVVRADLHFSGASDGDVAVSDALTVSASGGSRVVYRGEPSVTSEVSGGSSVARD